jgi:metallo-beta-lactamase family protein
MHITFYGAAREVTGSMHLLTTNTDRILLDCGLFQGRRKEAAEKNKVMPFDPGIITNVVLSHAHIDHSGRLPILTRNGFNGRIISTGATADACAYLLPDSAHIQESDADYLNYKLVRSTLATMRKSPRAKTLSKRKLKEIKALLKKDRHELNTETINEYIHTLHLDGVEPLYTMADAEGALEYFDIYPYNTPVTVGKNMTCTLYDAGHILGSAMILIKVRANGISRTIMHTGDIGRFNMLIIKDPCLDFAEGDRDIDLLIMESTYGNHEHESLADLKPRLQRVLVETFERGGTVLIPAFAYGRTQSLLYLLHELYSEKSVPRVPVYVDSPLATNLTRVYGEHFEAYDKETHAVFLEKGINPFQFDKMHFVGSVAESMALNRQDTPQIIIAAAGMCEAGRILHHLRHKIHNPKHTILLVGYMAQNTLGRRIEEEGLAYEASSRRGDPPMLRFLNKYYPLRAHVVKIDGLSVHADKNELMHFLKKSNLRVKKIAIVHGEEEQSLPFAERLRGEGYSVFVPKRGETVEVR